MSMVLVRPAETNDIERILGMDSSAPVEARRAFVQNAVSRGECWVAVDNEVLAGFGVMSYVFFERGFISLVYVDSAQRRRGVGTNLFDEFERRCRSANLSNLPMQSFLVSRGYVLSGVVQDLDDGDPEMFYSKSLR